MEKLKSIFTAVVLVQLLLFNSVIAQNDLINSADSLLKTPQTYSLENGTFYYKRLYLTPEGQIQLTKTEEFKNLSIISLSKNGKIKLKNSFNETDTTEIKYAQGLKIVKGSYLGTGILLGASLGTIAGLLIGMAVDEGSGDGNKGFNFKIAKPVLAGVGLLAGALIGGITGAFINNDEYINLTKYDESRKRLALLNFLKNK